MFWLGYALYADRFEKVFKPDRNRKTPAHTQYDGVDFVPAKHWSILFGHHFASIAGAAPVVGPVLAVSIWGWAPTLLWVVLGTVFIGGIHDYCSLMISVRHKGHTIADITETVISRKAKLVFLSFVWLTLILVVAVFTHICAWTFVVKPEIVAPSLGLIPIAFLAGILLYSKRYSREGNQLWVTLLGLFGLAGLIYAGTKFPISLTVANPIQVWSAVLLLYAYIASVLPVQILLQPRDYLSAFLLLAGLLFGYTGVIVSRPNLNFPAFLGWSGEGQGILWPALFVTVACGAISGFHSLVASGTTSKQLPNEIYGKKIGYGGMVAEGLVATLTLLVVACAFSQVSEFRQTITSGGGPVAAFGYGYGKVTEFFMGRFGELFAVLILNTFILTTLDTATRIGRYLTEELFRFKNRYMATLLVVVLSGWLALGGEWKLIWPIFGSANQLIAALALIVITCWFLSANKPIRYTLIPAVFMLATTIGALIFNIREYIGTQNIVLLVISLLLLFLALVVLYEAISAAVRNYRRKHHGKDT